MTEGGSVNEHIWKPRVTMHRPTHLWTVQIGDTQPNHGYPKWEDAIATALSHADVMSVLVPRPPRVIGWRS